MTSTQPFRPASLLPKAFAEYEGRTDHMPLRAGQTPPDCLRHFGTTWILVSKSGAAFVMDCGSTKVIDQIQERRKKGEIRTVEGLWVTHYHNDHTEAIPDFQKTFDCPCITDRSVAEVIANPLGWYLPCVSRDSVRVDRSTRTASPGNGTNSRSPPIICPANPFITPDCWWTRET